MSLLSCIVFFPPLQTSTTTIATPLPPFQLSRPSLSSFTPSLTSLTIYQHTKIAQSPTLKLLSKWLDDPHVFDRLNSVLSLSLPPSMPPSQLQLQLQLQLQPTTATATATTTAITTEKFISTCELIFNELFEIIQQKHQLSIANINLTLTDTLKTTKLLTNTSPVFFQSIIDQLSEIGWKNVVDLEETDLSRVTLAIEDGAGRSHELTLNISPGVERGSGIFSVVASADLPVDFPPKEKKESDSDSDLVGLVKNFRATLTNLQPLFDALDDIDTTCMVLEPVLPASRSTRNRRIALTQPNSTNNSSVVSMVFEVDVCDSPEPVDVKFVGPGDGVRFFRNKYSAFNFDNKISFRANLVLAFGSDCVCAPQKADAAEEGVVLEECGICYSYRLDVDDVAMDVDGGGGGGGVVNNQLPDISCTTCAKPFHEVCAFEWLSGAVGNRVAFDQIYGECPYCGGGISCRVRS